MGRIKITEFCTTMRGEPLMLYTGPMDDVFKFIDDNDLGGLVRTELICDATQLGEAWCPGIIITVTGDDPNSRMIRDVVMTRILLEFGG